MAESTDCLNSIEALQETIRELGLKNISLSRDFAPLARPVDIGRKTARNPLAVLPMEGCDGEPDGSPGALSARRYLRFARGGYGLICWEACAVTPEGRANELQLMLTGNNAGHFAGLLQEVNRTSGEENGFAPVNILQLTHSGRYSRPAGHTARPVIPKRDPFLDPAMGLQDGYPVAGDEYLESLVPRYVKSAVLAKEAGFDGVDIKSCHCYLFSELLAGFKRPGKYGGSLENRTRLILRIIKAVKAACGEEFIISCRFNMFDAHPYPYGFGCDRDDMWKPDLTEPVAFVKALCEAGAGLLSCTAGNPYYIYPQVTRPYNPAGGTANEHPLTGVDRLFGLTGEIRKAAGGIPVIGSGYTWLRDLLPFAAAANLERGACSFVGFGRSAFAYPEAPKDILGKGLMNRKKCCIACGKCTQIMRDHGRTGCVIKDSEVYAPLYKQYRAGAEARKSRLAQNDPATIKNRRA